MSETYARGSREQTRAGGVILVGISLLTAILVIAGAIYAAGTGERHKVALAAADCAPNLSPSGLECTTVRVLANRYMTITNPAIQQLNTDVAAYSASESHHLAAAESALMAEVTAENAFGSSLERFPFPSAIARIAKTLIQANHARAMLTTRQARSSSLTRLRSFNRRVKRASDAVQTQMKLIRKGLDSRPTAAQEP